MNQNVFKYKLDFYYQQTLIYLVTLVLYGGILGSFVQDQFVVAFSIPILYVIILFFCIALVTLFLNIWRQRKLIVEQDRIIFHARHREKEIHVSDIEWMHIGRERFVQTAGRFQQISIKLKGRRRAFRIRVGRYERDRELVAEMERIAERVPKRKLKRFPLRRE
jgi:hypothetical protein